MTEARDSYSPERRTALLFTGTGADGAYHAGAMRALQEAGVKIDIVGGRGIGAVSAVLAAVDGSAQLWDDGGFKSKKVLRYKRVVVPEMNLGQLALLLRGRFLVDIQSYTQVRGLPFKAAELASVIREVANDE